MNVSKFVLQCCVIGCTRFERRKAEALEIPSTRASSTESSKVRTSTATPSMVAASLIHSSVQFSSQGRRPAFLKMQDFEGSTATQLLSMPTGAQENQDEFRFLRAL